MKPTSQLFKLLTKNSFDIISVLSAEGIIQYESDATQRILGYESGLRNNHNVFEYVHPNDRDNVKNEFLELLKQPDGYKQVTFRYKDHKGTWVWLESNGQNFLNNPDIKGIIVNSRNITEEKKKEQELKERVKELNCLQELSNLVESNTSVNKILAKLTNVLKHSYQFPDFTEVAINYRDEQFRTRDFTCTTWMQETKIIVNSEEHGKISIAYTGENKIDHNPFLKEEYNMLRLVSERVGYIIERFERAQSYGNLVGALSEAVLKADNKGCIVEANQAAVKLCGYKSIEEMLGLQMVELYANPETRYDVLKMIEKSGDKVKNFEFQLKQKNGNFIWVLCNIQLLRNENGIYTGTLGVFRDIAEIKQTQQELLERNNEVETLLLGTRLVLECKDFLTTAKQIFQYCRELTGAKAGYVALLNDNGEENDVLYLEPGGLPCTVDPSLPMPIRGLRKIVYETGKTTYDNNYAKSPHVKFMPEGHIPLQNVMFAPLKSNGKVIGLLGLGEKENGFNENDAKIASSLAELISIALSNTRYIEKIEESQQKYRRLFDNSNSHIIEVDADSFEIVSCNSIMAKNFNAQPEELIGKNIHELLPQHVMKRRIEYGEKALREKQIQVFEDERNGRYFLNNFIPIIHNGKRYIETITYDITDRKKAENTIIDVLSLYQQMDVCRLDEILETGINAGLQACNASIGYFHFINDNQTNISLQVWSKSAKEQCGVSVESNEYPLCDSGIWADCIRTKQPEIHNHYNLIKHKGGLPEGHVEIHNHMSVPVVQDAKVVAVMGVGNKTSNFTPEDSNHLTLLANNIWNIYSRKITEQNLLNSEEKFKTLFEQSAVGLATTTSEGDIINVNKMLCDMLGYSKKELLSINVGEISHPDDWGRESEIVAPVLNGDLDETSMVKRYITKSGETIWCKMHSYSVRDSMGKIDYIIGAVTDITDQVNVEQELKESEEKFRTIFNMSQSMICVADINTSTFTVVNDAFTEILGYSEKELTSKPFMEFIHPDDVEATNDAVEKELLKGKKVIHFENRYRCKDNTYKWLDWNSYPLPEKGFTYAIAHDVTARRETEIALRLNEKRYRELSATKDKLLSIIAHDLRNPFYSIIGFSDLAIRNIKRNKTEKLSMYFSQINSTARNSYALLNNLLEWSRMQTGTIQYNPEYLNLFGMVETTSSLYVDSCEEKNIRMVVDVDKNVRVFADPFMLQTVLRNLISNAIKYTKDKGEIEIIAHQRHNEVCITVADNGVGISKANQKKLFKIEENYTSPGTNNEKGTGLGLMLCKEFIEKHGGELQIESTENKGTRFSFSLRSNGLS